MGGKGAIVIAFLLSFFDRSNHCCLTTTLKCYLRVVRERCLMITCNPGMIGAKTTTMWGNNIIGRKLCWWHQVHHGQRSANFSSTIWSGLWKKGKSVANGLYRAFLSKYVDEYKKKSIKERRKMAEMIVVAWMECTGGWFLKYKQNPRQPSWEWELMSQKECITKTMNIFSGSGRWHLTPRFHKILWR